MVLFELFFVGKNKQFEYFNFLDKLRNLSGLYTRTRIIVVCSTEEVAAYISNVITSYNFENLLNQSKSFKLIEYN